ncbi:MAG TPA: hypothetical protein GX497_13780 [Bacillus bacterium]|nr:hypothetical protein [Bacillus sp. (in: firmicutes)]
MMKTCVVLNGKTINVGEWDYQFVDVDGEQVAQNPIPDGAVIEERDFEYSEEFGWRETCFVPQPTEIEKLQQENADLAFNIMLVEGEAQTARQEVADLNFTLMINGVI